MSRTTRAAGAALALLVLAVAPTPTHALREEAYWTSDGATYYLAAGGSGTGHATLGQAYSGQPALPFNGCVLAMLRPDRDHGRVLVNGVLANATVFVDVGNFVGDGAKQGGVAANLTLDPSLDVLLRGEPPVAASAAAWGTARGAVEGANLTDPVGGGSELPAAFWVSEDGYRDDATGRISAAGGGQYGGAGPALLQAAASEIHLRLRSPPDAVPATEAYAFASTADTPLGLVTQDSDYLERFSFPDTRFSGTATVTFQAQSLAAPGLTELLFLVYSPGGLVVANKTLAPSVTDTNGVSATVEFPLTDFGIYTVRVSGRMAMASHSIHVELAPPKDGLDLNLWWDRVAFGKDASSTYGSCMAHLGSTVASTSVGRARPPSYPTEYVLVAALGVAAAILVVMKLVAHTRSAASFQRSRGGK